MRKLCFVLMMLIALPASAAGIRQWIDGLKPAPVQPAPQPKPPAQPNPPIKK